MNSKYYEDCIADIPVETDVPQGLKCWDKLGFLRGIDEDEKKYLSDLFDNVARLFTPENEDVDFRDIDKLWNASLWFEDKDVNNPEVNLKTDYIVVMFPIVRMVFTGHKKLTYPQFIDALTTIELDKETIEKLKVDAVGSNTYAFTACAMAIANKMIVYLKNKYRD